MSMPKELEELICLIEQRTGALGLDGAFLANMRAHAEADPLGFFVTLKLGLCAFIEREQHDGELESLRVDLGKLMTVGIDGSDDPFLPSQVGGGRSMSLKVPLDQCENAELVKKYEGFRKQQVEIANDLKQGRITKEDHVLMVVSSKSIFPYILKLVFPTPISHK